ncbi:FTR1 family protein [Streptomyces sp. NPDC001928]|uniref:FTR1 family iron permease n=1 Tax=Streptomyces sp. NPDC001928 TaxID=3154404 RepID=UPI0033318AF5
MFANYPIGLREGLEASLVVCILVAYLVKSGNRSKLPPIWLGVGIAVALSLSVSAVLLFGSIQLTFEAQEMFGGGLSIIAVAPGDLDGFLDARRTARHLRAEQHGKLDQALAIGSGSLMATAFLAVGREVLETALFVWSAVQAPDNEARPLCLDGSRTLSRPTTTLSGH